MRKIPISKSTDPFFMNENEVNLAVAEYLFQRGVEVKNVLVDKETGIDVLGLKMGQTLIIESKGSMVNNQHEFVFEHGQLTTHVSQQVHYLMKKYQSKYNSSILFMANPDIPRIHKRVDELAEALDALGIVRLWVQKNGAVRLVYPEQLKEVLVKLELIE
ncbi:hypothetical protein [Paenibacillus terrae]|uniref:NERD domain-containing protein n=1 Tax=Paenibacillus terrae TaxID=159743 RepID=A0A0D7XAD1_9BACL|nr:hypothetical protein [Paenibacillus terrae]KJD47132.1 hypothetical protein QD47_02980 [Paenibacillus terrae]